MKIVKTAYGENKIKISKKEWEKIGRENNWKKNYKNYSFPKKLFAAETINDLFEVVDNEFNRANYPDLIGKTFENPPAYARVKKIKQEI